MSPDRVAASLASEASCWLTAWAKTGVDDDKRVCRWMPLHQHLSDTAAVAARLVDEWISPQVVRRIAVDLGCDDDVRTAVTWLAAVHDVGKISPAFAVQVPELADAMRRIGSLSADPRLRIDPERSRIRHEYVGQHVVKNWLVAELGFPARTSAAQFAGIVGGHHGAPPSSREVKLVGGRPDLAGSGPWRSARDDALRWASDLVGGPDVLRRFADVRLSRPSQVLLGAVVIVADWIASNPEFFPLEPLHTADEPPRLPNPVQTAQRVAAAWAELDLPERWSPRLIADAVGAFTERFGRAPRPVQVAAVEAAGAQERPGMVIVEAPMGEGKTEAALMAAEVLAARSSADGCFVALPTRATSDAMFTRVLDWMRALPDLPGDASVMLAHGTASLNDEYRGLMRAGFLQGIGDEQDDQVEAGIAHRWLRGRKKGPLSQFVIGTVDQVLLAGLKSRHLVMRHLALAGKVVVIDEVHAYDVYMSRYLDRVLHWLGAYGTPVVLLSATLPAQRRAELMAAYDGTSVTSEPGYPVVLASGLDARQAPASRAPVSVAVECLPDDPGVLLDTLRTALRDGGCAVVVRNTVARVQETADQLITEFGDEQVTVAHSRFLACDRARLDAGLLRRFGPPGPATQRPEMHIVVASQVVEQSLDVDFDLMITDLAPVDLVLQRMGRLHRHVRTRPPGLTEPRCVLVGTEDWAGAPVRAVTGSRRVYGEHTLFRSAALLGGREAVVLPDDIAPLVQTAYSDVEVGPASWQDAMRDAESTYRQQARNRQEQAGDFLVGEVGGPDATLDAWVRAGVGDAESEDRDPRRTGQVRDGAESVEVVVVQRDRDDGILTPDWIDSSPGVQIPLDDDIPPGLARVIAACALRLPIGMSQMNAVGNGVIAALEQSRYTSFDRSNLLKGELVLVLDDDRRAEIRHGAAAFQLTYDPRRGLIHAKA